MTRAIGIEVKPVDVHADYEVEPPPEDCPLASLVRAVAQVMQSHPSFSDVAFLAPSEMLGEIEPPDRDLKIEVVLCARREDIGVLLDNPMEDCIGCFATTSGAFNPDTWKADCFRVIVPCDVEYLRAFVAEQRSMELDPEDDRYDINALKAYLVTVTHELSHAREFILHGHGLTPAEVDDYYDAGLIDYDCFDVCTGRMIREEMLEQSLEECTQIMEERVEEEGRKWLDWAARQIEPERFDAVLEVIKSMGVARDIKSSVRPR